MSSVLFRQQSPSRRTNAKAVKSYGEYKPDLRVDYLNRCGYCNSIDIWRFEWFEIDHFVPQKVFKTIGPNDYHNLVYACRSCNNAKRAKWPSNDESVHNINDEGFIDPCDENYSNQFERISNGRIKPITKLGGWMYNALKLYKPQHEIIYNIEVLDSLINEMEEILKK